MSTGQAYDSRTIKGKRLAAQPSSAAGSSHLGPTSFFLKSEKEVERGVQRGRKVSRSSVVGKDPPVDTMPTTGDSSFGVESLADTINSAFLSDLSLSRTDSNNTDRSTEAGAEVDVVPGRKRKARNPVHPSILAAGQRIISNERPSLQASSSASPVSLRSSESPYRVYLRRGSASSVNFNSQPLTPLRMSPQPDSAMPSTPRSGSPKSFRLSDEEGSVVDETGSQALQSSNGDEDDDVVLGEDKVSSMPQLVMPSISLPARRHFTEKGKRMGRLRVMVVGSNGSGKTSLIQNIVRSSEDIVHVDPAINDTLNNSLSITETFASTRPYPSWWTDFESRRMLLRRKSMGDGVLERNICLIDTPRSDREDEAQEVLDYFNSTLLRTANLEKMTDTELINLLSGDGGVQIDATLWLFDPTDISRASSTELIPEGPQRILFETLCRCTNLIPLIGHSDIMTAEEVVDGKEKVRAFIQHISAETYTLADPSTQADSPRVAITEPAEPLVVSSALADDTDEVDASVLMSSQYLQPLATSDLDYLTEQLLEPDNIARMRHLSATKFLIWRQQKLGAHIDLQRHTLRSPQFGHTLPSVTSTGSLREDTSQVLVPYSTSSYFRSDSPSASECSALAGNAVVTSAHALAHHNDQTQGSEPFHQVRLAKWAQDLQRSLNNERQRYQRMYTIPTADWTVTCSDAEKSDNHEKALSAAHSRPARGRLGGDIAIVDPRDPLGILAFSQALRRRGWFAIRIAGGMGLIGYGIFWVTRNWAEVQEFLGIGQPIMVNAPAVPAPTKGVMDYVDNIDWRAILGG